MAIKLKIDPVRWAEEAEWNTGIYVRAYLPDGKCVSADIAVLEKDSLKDWLLAKPPACAVNTVGILLRGEHLLTNEEAVKLAQRFKENDDG